MIRGVALLRPSWSVRGDALPTRLMVGLHLIKHARGLSDEQVCAQWLENAYFQYFSGETYFQTALPLDRTSMSVWRGRIGPEKLEALIAETLAAARRAGGVEPPQMRRLTIDTTAQTKAVAHPTDSHLLLRAIEWLNGTAKKQGVAVRQSYLRVARHARREVGRLMHAGQRKQAERWVRKLRTWTGRLTRDIERKTVGEPDLVGALAFVLDRVKRLLAQKRDGKNKLYALHAPEVECIAKGKARTRYEFRVKVSIAVTNARAAGGQFVLGIQAMPGLPYDGHALKDQIAQVERLTGEDVARVYVDKGYRGHGLAAPESTSRRARANGRRRSNASCAEGPRSSRSSAMPNPTACSNATVSPTPEATPSTPSSSAPDTTSVSCSPG
jgi:transposase, IS5 family